jgi:hypothetical protein
MDDAVTVGCEAQNYQRFTAVVQIIPSGTRLLRMNAEPENHATGWILYCLHVRGNPTSATGDAT